MLHIVASLTDDSRGIIYVHDMIIIQATGSMSLSQKAFGQ